MTAPDARPVEDVDADRILSELSTRQHLHPHRSLGQVLGEAQREIGFCPGAVRAALEWLRFDPAKAIGRLRRSELIQLAPSIHRFWRQARAGGVPQSQLA